MTTTDGTPQFATQQHRPEHECLLQRLETSYELHTEQIARLTTVLSGDTDHGFTRDALVAMSRQALADIAAALRDMAEGRYGVCEGCGEPIPVERLHVRPEARYCLPCQAKQRR